MIGFRINKNKKTRSASLDLKKTLLPQLQMSLLESSDENYTSFGWRPAT